MASQPTPVELTSLEREAAQATVPKRRMSERRARRARVRQEQVLAAEQREVPKSKQEVEVAVKRTMEGPSPYRIRGFVLSWPDVHDVIAAMHKVYMHSGTDKLVGKLYTLYGWNRLRSLVRVVKRSCHACQLRAPHGTQEFGLLQQPKRARGLFDHVFHRFRAVAEDLCL
ncbi:hypothetical protein SARC_02816 [Sphaeroforma arctica JP610]|uniref:Integrase zinc-binding domain-containing protein n=1 Tax=Sphaeroforma arctica JP610 TaxID=667725 RepID=A0A0L0G7U0_9EUKA|nr:hypothetical protein SARC_02816 [Sphaeroforma arctica JP610]KNC84961.1 hypothetical protein SARC_02816 [Sphaeroforma arctica JP610]|eukprot:XP_014158863.1 hypothetical protein SARC_02816 [Sphaeroforma arctica JP610]